MATKFLTACMVFAATLAAHCADEQLAILKVGSVIYTNVTVTTVTATDIHFFNKHGIGNAKLKDLEPELQAHFHFNSETARAAEQQRAAGNAAYLSKIESTKPATVAAAEHTPAPAAEPQSGGQYGIPAHKISAQSFLHQKAPNFVVEKWLTPQPSTDGKFILIDFWATWCGPCKQAIPHLNGLHAKYKDQVVFVGLSDETEREVRQLSSPQIDYSVAIDTEHRMKSEIKVTGIPHVILIDPHGYVRYEGHPNYLTDQNFGALVAQYSK